MFRLIALGLGTYMGSTIVDVVDRKRRESDYNCKKRYLAARLDEIDLTMQVLKEYGYDKPMEVEKHA